MVRWLRAALIPTVGVVSACSMLIGINDLRPPPDDDGPPSGPAPTEAGVNDAGPSPSDAAALDSGASDCGSFKYPPVSSFVPDFSAGLAPWWQVFGSPCVQATAEGLVAAPTASVASQYCTAYSAALFHLTCDSLTVKVAEVTDDLVGAQTYVYVNTPAGTIIIVKEASSLQFFTVDAGTPDKVAYDRARDVWWRLRESGGSLIFETSPDGATWGIRSQLLAPNVDQVKIGLGAGVYKALPTSGGRGVFRCLNARTACD